MKRLKKCVKRCLNETATFFRFYIVILYYKRGVYSNDHLNISDPMHRGVLTSIDPLHLLILPTNQPTQHPNDGSDHFY